MEKDLQRLQKSLIWRKNWLNTILLTIILLLCIQYPLLNQDHFNVLRLQVQVIDSLNKVTDYILQPLNHHLTLD